MIQRIQTVYLALGAMALLALLFFDAIWSGSEAASFGWFPLVMLLLTIATAVLAFGSIFMYKKRAQQRKLVVYAQMLTLLLMVVLYGLLYMSGELVFVRQEGLDISRMTALALPIIAYLLFYLARKSIERDIELVRSMDRLR